MEVLESSGDIRTMEEVLNLYEVMNEGRVVYTERSEKDYGVRKVVDELSNRKLGSQFDTYKNGKKVGECKKIYTNEDPIWSVTPNYDDCRHLWLKVFIADIYDAIGGITSEYALLSPEENHRKQIGYARDRIKNDKFAKYKKPCDDEINARKGFRCGNSDIEAICASAGQNWAAIRPVVATMIDRVEELEKEYNKIAYKMNQDLVLKKAREGRLDDDCLQYLLV